MNLRTKTLCAALLLAGCVETNSPNVGGEVGPGSQKIDGIFASSIFNDVCGSSAPSFENAPVVMASMPFVQHPQTGTFYHQSFNLSIKVAQGQCSMVFASNDSPSELGLMIAAGIGAAGGSNEVSIDPVNGVATSTGPGRTKMIFEPALAGMYRIVLIAP